jgi:hypothetical protein
LVEFNDYISSAQAAEAARREAGQAHEVRPSERVHPRVEAVLARLKKEKAEQAARRRKRG